MLWWSRCCLSLAKWSFQTIPFLYCLPEMWKPDNLAYRGQRDLDGRPQGSGSYDVVEGDCKGCTFSGKFVHGERVRGKFTWTDGDSYDGEWFNEQRHGVGTFKWADGSIYKGQWEEGLKNGFGKVQYWVYPS